MMLLATYLLLLAAHGFMGFLWLVFGLAAAGSATSHAAQVFIWSSALGAAIPLVASICCFARGMVVRAFVMAVILIPSAGAMFVLAGVAKI